MDCVLADYRSSLIEQTGWQYPNFAQEAVHTAEILALLESPSKSGAEVSGECSIDNPDQTARRQLRLVNQAGISRERIVFWNFYASYNPNAKDDSFWAAQTEALTEILPNLRVVIVFGNKAWKGMRDVWLPLEVALIGAPHPANRSCNSSNPLAEPLVLRAWFRARSLLDRQKGASVDMPNTEDLHE